MAVQEFSQKHSVALFWAAIVLAVLPIISVISGLGGHGGITPPSGRISWGRMGILSDERNNLQSV